MNNTMLSLNRNMKKLDSLYMQMTTLKKIQRPSDDPITAGRALKFRTKIAETQQFQDNIDQAMSWMSSTEEAIKNIESILGEMRDRCLQGANDTLGIKEQKILADQIKELKKHFINEGNVTYDGERYLFSGFKTDKPLMLDNGQLNPEVYSETASEDKIEYDIGINNKIQINVLGKNILTPELMGDPNDPESKGDIDMLIDQVNAALEGDTTIDVSDEFNKLVGKLDTHLSRISAERAGLGNRMKRLELVNSRLQADELNFKELNNNNEGVDLEEVYTEFSMQQVIYNSALNAASKIIQPTLLDFIR